MDFVLANGADICGISSGSSLFAKVPMGGGGGGGGGGSGRQRVKQTLNVKIMLFSYPSV